ncbi:MAG: M20/M25/M40 family metallo-hydrolase [Caulobacteraceae bacterium]|nr:M20/M25/M40 family metallo-hydrolase [Caulobacteraceae bacterium]
MRLHVSSAALIAALVLSGCMTAAEAPPAPAAPVVDAQLWSDLSILAADDMQGRGPSTPGGEKARAYIVSRFEEMGIAAPAMGRLQPFQATSRRGATVNGVNVLGVIPGTRRGDRYIVVTAHYDHVGAPDGVIHNGADDNASGVATMLALAAELKRQAPEHSVIFVAFDAEESGLLGAKHFVEAPPVPLESIALNLNFDMTARAETDSKLWVTGTYQHPSFRPLLEGIAPVGGISLAFGKDTPQDTGANNWVEASDHGAFFRANVPFLYLGVEFHPDYHQPTDDVERVQPAVFQSSTTLAIQSFRALDAGLSR